MLEEINLLVVTNQAGIRRFGLNVPAVLREVVEYFVSNGS
jgi:hypothetical protein